MGVGHKSKVAKPDLKYRPVKVAAIKRGRRGKHYGLMQGILREMEMLAPGSALEVPLSDVGGVVLANLRSAVHRACTARGWTIETVADENNFYAWKTGRSEP